MRLRAGQRTGRITATDVTKGITAGGRSQRTHDGGLIWLRPSSVHPSRFRAGIHGLPWICAEDAKSGVRLPSVRA